MRGKSLPWSARTTTLAAAPTLFAVLGWALGGVFGYGHVALLAALLVWAPTPLGLGMRLLDRDMDDYTDTLLAGAGEMTRAKTHLWLLQSATTLGRDLRVWTAAWVFAVLVGAWLVW